MQIDTKGYIRKPFHVQAIQVTTDNMKHIAKWCKGTVTQSKDALFIKVNVHRPLNERQSKAFVGDWVLKSDAGFKVYSQRAFETSFELDAPDPVTSAETPQVDFDTDIEAVREASKSVEKFRDARTGEYVTHEYAQANPDTTVTETEFLAVTS